MINKTHNIYLVLTTLALLTNGSLTYAALSATTSQTIKGSAPKLTPDHELDILNKQSFTLFGLEYEGEKFFSDSDITTKIDTLLSPLTSRPLDLNSIQAIHATLVDGNNVIDIDGDGDFTISGATVKWFYDNSSSETLLDPNLQMLTFCELSAMGIKPYLKVSGPITLSTHYGDPNISTYPNDEIKEIPYRNFNINFTPSFCFATPNMTYGSTEYDPNDGTWHTTYGFINRNDSSKNFPSTGTNNIYFYLIINGTDASKMSWSASSTGNVTANISHTGDGRTNYGFIPFYKQSMVQVSLSGPDVLASDKNTQVAPDPNHLPAPFSGSKTSPVKITITGKDTSVIPNVEVSYSFELKQWFIARGNTSYDAASSNDNSPLPGVGNGITPDTDYKYADVWCANLNQDYYTMPSIPDLTHTSDYGWIGTNPNKVYQRSVGNGFFPEWGYVGYYNVDLVSTAWTRQIFESKVDRRYIVFVSKGSVGWSPVSNKLQVLCVNQ